MKSKNEVVFEFCFFLNLKIEKFFGFKFPFWIPKLLTFLDSISKNDRVLRFDFKNKEVFRFQILLNPKTLFFLDSIFSIQKRDLRFHFCLGRRRAIWYKR